MRSVNISRLIFSIAVCQSAGVLGSFFTISAIPAWYSTLVKPSFTPPNFLFAPVWLTLYTLMGISLYLIWSSYVKASKKQSENKVKRKEIKNALILFGIHLILNALWTVIFFGFRNIFLGFLEIAILWFLIIVIIYKFWQIDQKAAYLLIPYIIWVTIAMSLNYNVWILNR